jgi:gamma-glutamylcyclotransferase (GGCT)/AIG2-like uncharacterized protein YtfP
VVVPVVLVAGRVRSALGFRRMASVRLFVYGSLKRAGRHHDQLRGAVFLGEAETVAGYALEQAGEYLELVSVAGAGSVTGELFEVSESLLLALDDFEGDAYHRGQVRLRAAPKAPSAEKIEKVGSAERAGNLRERQGEKGAENGENGAAGAAPLPERDGAGSPSETALAYFKKAR